MKPVLQICIVSYNTRDLLDDCLHTLFQSPPQFPFAVTVVDNASKDASVAMVRSNHPDVRIVETGANIGYGRANNAGLLGQSGDYYLVLNSDTRVPAGTLDKLVAYMQAHPNVWAAGGALILPDGTPQKTWAVGEMSLWNVFCEQTYLAKLFPNTKLFGDFMRVWWRRDSNQAIPQACGACLIVRADLFNRLGGFDPKIFMYAEDTDLCKRIRDLGHDIHYIADAPITHLHGQSSLGGMRLWIVTEYNKSRLYYFAKHTGPTAQTIAKVMMVFGALLRSMLWMLAIPAKGRAAFEKAAGFVLVAYCTAVARVRVAPDRRQAP